MSAIAELGGESPEYFDKMFGSMDEGGAHCMRTVMYPKRAPEDIPKKSMTHTNDGRGDLSSIIFRAPLLFLERLPIWYNLENRKLLNFLAKFFRP